MGFQSLCLTLNSKPGAAETGLPLHEISSPTTHLESYQASPLPSPPVDLLFLLLCYGEGRYATKLLQLDLITQNATTDEALFQLLRQSYTSMRGPWLLYLSLRTLTSIRFVHFEMYKNSLVDVRKVNDIPPPENLEYRYAPAPPEIIPPIGERHLLHLFQNPDCADKESVCADRFPKKLREVLKCSSGAKPGWGLQLVEDWDWQKIWLIGFVFFGLGSFLIGIMWAVYNHSVQDAFAIASYVVAFGAVSVGTLQTLLVL